MCIRRIHRPDILDSKGWVQITTTNVQVQNRYEVNGRSTIDMNLTSIPDPTNTDIGWVRVPGTQHAMATRCMLCLPTAPLPLDTTMQAIYPRQNASPGTARVQPWRCFLRQDPCARPLDVWQQHLQPHHVYHAGARPYAKVGEEAGRSVRQRFDPTFLLHLRRI